MSVLVKHGTEYPNTIGLTNNPEASCTSDGEASDPVWEFPVELDENGEPYIRFYSCRASSFGA